MKFRALLLGTAALALFAAPVFAADYAGGAIKTSTIDGKEVLTDAKGMTLYTFDKDTAGVTNCYDKCAVNWPPLLAADGAVADGEFTLVDRTDGTKMWAHEGWPLYLWVKDTKPGDVTGDGVGDVWHTALD
jgi:predicted lipoprotein with Yx(FWY)xxD motif